MANNTSKSIRVVGFLLMFGAAALAAPASGSVSGTVKDSTGKPQMGAVIEVFTSALAQPLRAFTDDKGFYRVQGIVPGTYFVKATASQFLPSLRENVILKPGSHVM